MRTTGSRASTSFTLWHTLLSCRADELMENLAIVRGLAGKLGLPGTGSGSGGSSSMN